MTNGEKCKWLTRPPEGDALLNAAPSIQSDRHVANYSMSLAVSLKRGEGMRGSLEVQLLSDVRRNDNTTRTCHLGPVEDNSCDLICVGFLLMVWTLLFLVPSAAADDTANNGSGAPCSGNNCARRTAAYGRVLGWLGVSLPTLCSPEVTETDSALVSILDYWRQGIRLASRIDGGKVAT